MTQLLTPEGSEESDDPSLSSPAVTPDPRAGSTFYAFQSPTYRVLWLTASLMLTTMHLSFTAHATVAFEITGKNSAVGVISFAIGIAMLLTIPFAGAIADRVSKRLLLFVTQSMLVLMALGLAAFLYADALTIGLMAAFCLMFGASVSFFWPAITACMGETVEADKQSNGAALFQIALNLTRSVVPFVGAALLSWQASGLGASYLVVVMILVLAAASLLLIPKAKPLPGPPSFDPAQDRRSRGGSQMDTAPRPSMLADMQLGLKHVVENPRLLVVMASFVVTILLAFSLMIVLPAFAKDVLGAGEAGFGIMFGTHAIGGLIAGLFVASKATSPRLDAYLFGSSLVLGVSVAALSQAPDFTSAIVVMLVVGGAAGAFQTLIMAAILRASAPEYFGRVMALTNVGWALNNLFGLLLGVLADFTSERTSLLALGALIVVAGVLLAGWRRRAQSGEYRVQLEATSP